MLDSECLRLCSNGTFVPDTNTTAGTEEIIVIIFCIRVERIVGRKPWQTERARTAAGTMFIGKLNLICGTVFGTALGVRRVV